MSDNLEIEINQLNKRLAKFFQAGDYERALQFGMRLKDLILKNLEPHHPHYARALRNLATIHHAAGTYREAETSWREAIETVHTIFGEDSTDFADCLEGLAKLYLSVGRHTEAEPLLRKALETRRKSLAACREALRGTGLDVDALESGSFWALGDKVGGLQAKLSEHHRARLDIADTLNSLGGVYRARREYAAAEPLLREAIEIYQVTVGEKEAEVAPVLNNLGGLYRDRGDYAAAELLLRDALEIRRKALGETHPDVANSLNDLARVYQARRNFNAAERLYCQALEIRRKSLGERHPRVAITLADLGQLYSEKGDYAAAEPHLRDALQLRREIYGDDHPNVILSLDELPTLYYAMGKYELAEPLFLQALEIRRKVFGEEHPSIAQALNNLAELYRSKGDFATAEPLYRQAQRILEADGKDHSSTAAIINNLAELYRAKGDYATAEPLYRRSLNVDRAVLGEGHPRVATSLNNLAELFREMRDHTAAEQLYLQALEIRRKSLGEEHPDVAQTLNNLAVLYRDRGDDTAAEPLFRQALKIRKKALGDDHPDVAQTLSNLAGLYRVAGRYEAAGRLYNGALQILRKAFGENHRSVAATLNNLGLLHASTGSYAAAEPLYRKAIEIDRVTLGESHPHVTTSLGNLASLLIATQRESEAVELMKHAAAIDDRAIEQIFSIGSERQRMAYLAALQGELAAFLSLACDPSRHKVTAQDALDLVLRRKGIGAEALAAQRDAVLRGRYPDLSPVLGEMLALRQRVAQKMLVGPGPDGPDAHRRQLGQWSARREQLEIELARQIPEMRLGQELRAANRKMVADALPEGTALIEIVRFDVCDFSAVPARGEQTWKSPRYVAFVLPAREPEGVQLIDLGTAEPIDSMVEAFRATITGGNRDLALEPLEPAGEAAKTSNGSDLRAAVFDRLLSALGGRTKLFIAPDAELTRVAFEALPTADGRHLIDDYHICYLNTGRDALRFGAAARESGAPLVAADPDFDLGGDHEAGTVKAENRSWRQSRDLERSALRFGRLNGARAEGERIAEMLHVAPLLGPAALEAEVKARRSPRIMHLATHGFFLSNQQSGQTADMLLELDTQGVGSSRLSRLSGLENPLLRSGLALAGANTWLEEKPLPAAAEDGILTAEDVSGMDLLATELVVLSACETGIGGLLAGEGVFGLRRAFVLAGARTLIMSLWKVPDKPTRMLMENFYRRALAGEGLAEAFRQAQLALKRRYPQPHAWGGFVCQGDPSPLALGTAGK